MEFLYSPTTNSFYPAEYEKDYKKNNNWPSDLVQVSYEDFKTFALDKPPLGMRRGYNKSGFVWLEVQLTPDQLLAMELDWCRKELTRADGCINRAQDGESGVGTISDWRNYRKNLRLWAEMTSPPDQKSKRPSAPDSKD